MFARIGHSGDYLTKVLPAVVIYGLGLAITVAPLTSTVLAAVSASHAGMASAANNTIARDHAPARAKTRQSRGITLLDDVGIPGHGKTRSVPLACCFAPDTQADNPAEGDLVKLMTGPVFHHVQEP
jgi:hypothetical protein